MAPGTRADPDVSHAGRHPAPAPGEAPRGPAPIGALDAIHLSTAELWREITGKDPLVATHDQALALAARASGFRVAGV